MRHLSLLLAALTLTWTAPAADWPSWHGPGGLGISSEKKLPTHKLHNMATPTPVSDGNSVWVLAIAASTGRNVWKHDRNLEPKDEAQDSYSTPVFLRSGGRTQMIVAGAESINAYDLKESTLSSPAISRGRLSIRTDEALYCIAP